MRPFTEYVRGGTLVFLFGRDFCVEIWGKMPRCSGKVCAEVARGQYFSEILTTLCIYNFIIINQLTSFASAQTDTKSYLLEKDN